MRGVLTKRQLWRRQKDYNIDLKLHPREQPHNLRALEKKSIPSDRIYRRDKKGRVFNEANVKMDSEKSDNRILSSDDRRKSTKAVRFDSRVGVIQIPTIEVYEKLGLADLIWFRESEFDEFKDEAVNELRKYMVNHKLLDSKLAIQQLYINDVPETLEDFFAAIEEEKSRSLLSSPATSCDTVNSENFIYPDSTGI